MYAIEYTKEARKDLKKLPANWTKRIVSKVEEVAQNPKGKHNNLKPLKCSEFVRLRVSDNRVILNVKDDIITLVVVAVKTRGSSYK